MTRGDGAELRSIPRIVVGFKTAQHNIYISFTFRALTHPRRLARALRRRACKAEGRKSFLSREECGPDAGLGRNGQTTSACVSRAPIESTGMLRS
jgi:hypothetical protein